MCGIVAYTGSRAACPIILKGLKRLEYRGYDSAGIALLDQELTVFKRKGKVTALEEELAGRSLDAHTGMGHTRWATHGEPSDRNAHPHVSSSGRLAVVHNGIIENYTQLKNELQNQGYSFNSDTDTEILLNFIENIQDNNQCSLEEALRIALKRVSGAYVLILLDKEQPDTLIAIRKGSPLVIGIGKDEHFMASDGSPLIEYTREVIFVNDHELAIIKAGTLTLKNPGNEILSPFVQKLDLELCAIEKRGYDHFMLKEIFEQPDTLFDCLRGRLNADSALLKMAGVENHIEQLKNAGRIVMVACGTSWHAALIAEYIVEELCRIPVEVEYASEFRYRNPIIRRGDIVVAISQSGETADTIVAIGKAKEQGAFVFGVVNTVGSSISRISDAGAYTHAGPEIGVASTKAFTAQLAVLTMFALRIAYEKGTLSPIRYRQLLTELEKIPGKLRETLLLDKAIRQLALKYKDSKDALYLGRGCNFPVALEGALKLKEISYIHAEGYPAAEMKHGPIALVDGQLPVIFVATRDSCYEKIVSNLQEIKARKGLVIALISKGDTTIAGLADDCIVVPETDEFLAPLVNILPLQLLAYHIGVAKGYDVDKPRNLAKSVTVE